MNSSLTRWTPLAAALAAALLLGACGRQDKTAGQAVDSTIAQAEQKADHVADEAKQAGAKVAAVARDAAITAEINAQLARDGSLSALKVDVDTHAGQVVLRGSAPDAAARERATRLAADVKGVSSVENQMTIDAPKS